MTNRTLLVWIKERIASALDDRTYAQAQRRGEALAKRMHADGTLRERSRRVAFPALKGEPYLRGDAARYMDIWCKLNGLRGDLIPARDFRVERNNDGTLTAHYREIITETTDGVTSAVPDPDAEGPLLKTEWKSKRVDSIPDPFGVTLTAD